MRLVASTDVNQSAIVTALRKIGCSVQILAAVGQGCPDLLCGYRGVNYLLEVKDGEKPPSKRKLTPDQLVWHAGWRGQVCVVETIQQAIEMVTKCHRMGE